MNLSGKSHSQDAAAATVAESRTEHDGGNVMDDDDDNDDDDDDDDDNNNNNERYRDDLLAQAATNNIATATNSVTAKSLPDPGFSFEGLLSSLRRRGGGVAGRGPERSDGDGLIGTAARKSSSVSSSSISYLSLSSQKTHERAGGIGETLLAQRLNMMSPRDRESTLHEVHGIASEVEETDELIQQSISLTLQELDALRNKSKNQHRDRGFKRDSSQRTDEPVAERTASMNTDKNDSNVAALERALQQDAKYVTDRDFLLQFIRTERFDHVKAAKRIARYFEEKEFLFGQHMLCKKIMLRDLDERCFNILNRGEFQILRGRDQGGRTVFFSAGALSVFRDDPLDIRAVVSRKTLCCVTLDLDCLFSYRQLLYKHFDRKTYNCGYLLSLSIKSHNGRLYSAKHIGN
jgi:hypothetical protein